MASRSAAGLLRSVKKPVGKRRSPGVTAAILLLTALAMLALLGTEVSMLRTHSTSKQAVTKKKSLVQNLRRYSPGDDPSLILTPPPLVQPDVASAKNARSNSLLKGAPSLTDRLVGTAPTGIQDLLSNPAEDTAGATMGDGHQGDQLDLPGGQLGVNAGQSLQSEEEIEAEALGEMGIAVNSTSTESRQQGDSYSEPPIVQPLSGLKQHGEAVVSVASNRQRSPEKQREHKAPDPGPSSQGFVFSGDLPGGDDFSQAMGRKAGAGSSPKSRASEAVARAKEKAAAAKARHGRGMQSAPQTDEERGNLLQAMSTYEAAGSM
eukprot:CAMPEP_0117666938 /NCGR_PEP_ID=MMETSP0804-20121206/10664_1 /TAXON_ID=1074897 /ORGANISM="Tetraselmis astigmatica, Strain CCMP880" /LENGTH=319 /DNA_ID=CAMNT_0005474559 /DNA_START=214 /DNA_END=1174 /DNA_ORIENTATION=+